MTTRLEQPGGAAAAQPLRPHAASLHTVGPRGAVRAAARPQAVVVAGMHRSGTSALARALSLCGLALPRTMWPADAHNEHGYWESDVVTTGNDELLRALDLAWDDALASSRDGRYPRPAGDAVKAMVRDEFAPDSDIVIKDPRISLMFGLWREALEDLGYETVLLIPVRHPLEVAASLGKRDGFPQVKSALLWLAHLIALERDSRGVARAFLTYDDLLADWRGVFKRAERLTGLKLPQRTPLGEVEIDRFLAPDGRHHRYADDALRSRSDIPHWVADAYEWALSAARAEQEPAPGPLAEIAAQFHASAQIYGPLLAFERAKAAPAAAGPEPAVDINIALYSAAVGSGYSEDTCERLKARVTPTPQALRVSTPSYDAPLTALRFDPADAKGQVLLHELKLLSADGEALWEWAGELDLFSRGVAAEELGERLVLLHFLDTDPQIELPVGAALADQAQAMVEVTLSIAEEAELARMRLRQQNRALAARVDAAGEQVAARLDALAAQAAEAQTAADARVAQLAAFLERRLTGLGEELMAQSRAAAQAYDSRLLELQQRLEIHAATEARLVRERDEARAQAETRARDIIERARERDEAAALAETRARERDEAAVLAETRARERDEARALAERRAQEAEAHAREAEARAQEAQRHAFEAQERAREIAALRLSTSWRLTSPLRTLKQHGPVGVLRQAARVARRKLRGKSYADPAQLALDDDAVRVLRRTSLFDPRWYLAHNPDVAAAGADPLAHYLQHGAVEGRNPGPDFDSRWYLAQNPDVAAAGLNPLVHYLVAGRKEQRTPAPPPRYAPARLQEHLRLVRRGRHWKHLIAAAALKLEPVLPRRMTRRLRWSAAANAPRPEEAPAQDDSTGAHAAAYAQLVAQASARGDEYAPLSPEPGEVNSRIRAIAFYLPQFHPIPENDSWWGKGFTEWTNVSKAAPQFLGHYQPRLPDELGFYDLRVPDVQRRQVELAKQHGLSGFCFHYYWFTGRKRLLERPLQQYVADKSIDFPFCICWANENWTRRWDGLDQDILMEQRHEPQDDLEFIEDLAPFLRDPRYIRIDGRPLIIVYRVDILPRPLETAQTWRDYCRQHGLGDPYLVAAQSFGITDPRPYGFDAALEFPPHGDFSPEEVTHEQRFLNPRAEGRVYSYERVAKRQMSQAFPDYTLFKGVMPDWDNEARKPGKGHAFSGSSPELYRAWLAAACRQTDQRYPNPEQKLVFINAWNEWAEGAYLEPDRRWGYAYLKATAAALAAFPAERRTGAVGVAAQAPPLYVMVHAFYADVFAEILAELKRLATPFTLIATCPPEREADISAAFARSGLSSPFQLVAVSNRGRDVRAFFHALGRVPGDAVILKLHTKKSVHREDGDDWRRGMLESLLAPDTVEAALAAFARDDTLGLIAPDSYLAPITTYIGFNQSRIEELLARGGWAPIDMSRDVFAAGTMFFIRRAAIDPLMSLGLTDGDYEEEFGQRDGTLAHALERMFSLAVLREGGRIIDTAELFGAPSGKGFSHAVKTDWLYRPAT